MKPRILAVVVTRNRIKLLKENINALLKLKEEIDILVVDNDSDDGTEEFLKSIKGKKIIYHNPKENLGGAYGFYYGMKYSLTNKYDYSYLMDDDAMPLDNSLTILLEKAKLLNNEFSFLAQKVICENGEICRMNKPDIVDENSKNNLIKCRSCSFVGVFINNKVAIKTALPIKEFFIYRDDIEYTSRLGKILPAYYIENSIIVHKTKNTKGVVIWNFDKEDIERIFYEARNVIYVTKKQGLIKLFKITIVFFVKIIRIIYNSKDNKILRTKTFLKGMIEGFTFNPKLEYVKEE